MPALLAQQHGNRPQPLHGIQLIARRRHVNDKDNDALAAMRLNLKPSGHLLPRILRIGHRQRPRSLDRKLADEHELVLAHHIAVRILPRDLRPAHAGVLQRDEVRPLLFSESLVAGLVALPDVVGDNPEGGLARRRPPVPAEIHEAEDHHRNARDLEDQQPGIDEQREEGQRHQRHQPAPWRQIHRGAQEGELLRLIFQQVKNDQKADTVNHRQRREQPARPRQDFLEDPFTHGRRKAGLAGSCGCTSR